MVKNITDVVGQGERQWKVDEAKCSVRNRFWLRWCLVYKPGSALPEAPLSMERLKGEP